MRLLWCREFLFTLQCYILIKALLTIDSIELPCLDSKLPSGRETDDERGVMGRPYDSTMDERILEVGGTVCVVDF